MTPRHLRLRQVMYGMACHICSLLLHAYVLSQDLSANSRLHAHVRVHECACTSARMRTQTWADVLDLLLACRYRC